MTAADLAAREADEVQGYVDGLGAVLLAFAALALLVGGFIIWNTFVGAGLGAALASAVTVQQAGTATVVLPARQLLADLVLAGAAGLIAAAVPARRAGRLDPLNAIGTQ